MNVFWTFWIALPICLDKPVSVSSSSVHAPTSQEINSSITAEVARTETKATEDAKSDGGSTESSLVSDDVVSLGVSAVVPPSRWRSRVVRVVDDFKAFGDSFFPYGQNFIHHLRGEFAFVLYDSKRQFLMAARDRFGIKPLYHTVVDGKLMIASEMKAVMALGWKPEWDLESIMQLGEYSDNRTVFKGVHKVFELSQRQSRHLLYLYSLVLVIFWRVVAMVTSKIVHIGIMNIPMRP